MMLPLNPNNVVYSVDTSSLVEACDVLYPMDNFPSLWDKIENLIKSNRLIMSQPVFDEAMGNEELEKWCTQKGLQSFLEVKVDEPVQNHVRAILKDYPGMINAPKNKSGADPWVVALALQYPGVVVVTEEKSTSDRIHPRIPDVCKFSNIEWVNIAGLVKKENWRF